MFIVFGYLGYSNHIIGNKGCALSDGQKHLLSTLLHPCVSRLQSSESCMQDAFSLAWHKGSMEARGTSAAPLKEKVQYFGN